MAEITLIKQTVLLDTQKIIATLQTLCINTITQSNPTHTELLRVPVTGK